MMLEDGSVRTTDMTLAVLLVTHGYCPVMERDGDNGHKVVWVLSADEADEFVEDLLDDYVRGATRVEPKRFVRELRAVRKDLYRYLGIGDQPRGVRVAPPHRKSA